MRAGRRGKPRTALHAVGIHAKTPPRIRPCEINVACAQSRTLLRRKDPFEQDIHGIGVGNALLRYEYAVHTHLYALAGCNVQIGRTCGNHAPHDIRTQFPLIHRVPSPPPQA